MVKGGHQGRSDPDRDMEIYRKWMTHRTMLSIGQEYGVTEQAIWQAIRRVQAVMPEVDRAAILKRELEDLERIKALATEIMNAQPAPAVSHGKIIYEPDTDQVVRDYSGQLAAADRVAMAGRELRKLLGLDSSVKADITHTVNYTIEGVDPETLK